MYNPTPTNTFSIKASTFTFKINHEEEEKIILDEKTNYVIPIYQRPYSWKEEQVKKLIKDIFISYWGYDKKSTPEPIFIGTMQLSEKKENGQQEIIDGQQRTSTFLILLKVLSLKFSPQHLLKNFDWLSSKVNNGEEDKKLRELIQCENLKKLENLDEFLLNKYVQNAKLINSALTQEIEKVNEDDPDFDYEKFATHLFSKIYFVVIETKASLSKTLKIFDAINTTGLDLGAEDIFKIRMYEYLNKDGQDESVFNKISALYEKIETKNKLFDRKVTDINGILHTYQFYLIAKYQLPKVLYTFGTNTFFDRLFETLFKINKWEHFKNNLKHLELSIEELDKLIEVRYDWENKWISGNYGTVEDASLLHLWWWSRYSRFTILVFIFLFKFQEDENRYEKLFVFSKKLIRVYLVYSINFQKSIIHVHTKFTNELINQIVNGDFTSIINCIDAEQKVISSNHKSAFKAIISGDILYSQKVKNILCRLSASLEEDFYSKDSSQIISIREKVFHKPRIDIEHIQSFNDEKEVEREDIRKLWGDDLNSLGNLVVLEEKINRSISNKSKKKLDGYKESELTIVADGLVEIYPTWSLESCRKRKEKEVDKLMKYFFE